MATQSLTETTINIKTVNNPGLKDGASRGGTDDWFIAECVETHPEHRVPS